MHGQDRKHHRALVALFVGTCAVASAPILVRFSDVGSSATGFYRMLFATIVLIPWLNRGAPAAAPRSRAWLWFWLVAAGACFGLDVLFFHAAARMTTVANATLLLNFAAIFMVLGGRFLFGEPVRPALIAGLVLALTGAALLMSHSLSLSVEHLRGDAFGIIAALFYAGYLLVVSRISAWQSTMQIMVWTSAVSTVVILPAMLLADGPFLAGDLTGWLVLLALGIVSHAFGQGLIAHALAHLPVGFSGVGLLVQPVAAAVYAWVLLGEALGPVQSVGGAIVIAGVLLARRANTGAAPVGAR